MKSRQRKTFRSRNQQPLSPTTAHTYHHTESSRSKGPLEMKSPMQRSNNIQVQQLMKQNDELRRQIIEMKVHQFYLFDDKKLKELIAEVQQLRKEVKKLKQSICQLQMEKDYLTTANIHLKNELKIQMTKEKSSRDSNRKYQLKQQETTRISDSARNTQDQISHLSHHGSNLHFLHSTALQQVLQDSKPPNDYQIQRIDKNQYKQQITRVQSRQGLNRGQIKQSRKTLMDKVLSPRGRREGSSSDSRSNEYLLCRRRDKHHTLKNE